MLLDTLMHSEDPRMNIAEGEVARTFDLETVSMRSVPSKNHVLELLV